MTGTRWLNWGDLPWLARGSQAVELDVCLPLLDRLREVGSVQAYLKDSLPELAAEFAANWVAVLHRTTDWQRIQEFGRQPIEQLPTSMLAEVLDRDAGCFTHIDNPSGVPVGLIAVPVRRAGSPELLVIAGKGLHEAALPLAMAAGRTLGLSLDVIRRVEGSGRRIERLRSTLAIASQLTIARETRTLLDLIASEAARLLECDRTSIFIWDKDQKEMVGCPALGVTDNMLRIPDTVGIVGESLQDGKVIRVDDAYLDPRFNKKVDTETGYKTRNLLCVPIIDADGQRIGVFEGINKLQGAFTAEDEESLHDIGLQVATALQNTQERERLTRRNKQLTEEVTRGVRIIGESQAIVAMRLTIDRLATTDLPVLVLGESGTGKEVVAQSLHYLGPRRDQPFVAVNCAAIAETLLESELFGHEKGAFTDAREARQGKFELAEGGTLFLDEIGDMSPGGQAKLLRVLEQKVVTRVGGAQNIRTNVRIVAATNANLAQKVRDRKFREDLYYRLSVVALELPPLRDRPEDILPLAEFFLDRFARQAGRARLGLTPDAKRRLQGHGWPGNIRELRNLMERVAFLCTRDRVDADDLAFILSPDKDPLDDGSTDMGLSDATARFQREYIRRMIKRARGNMSQAAELLGLHRSNLYRKMRLLKMHEVEGQEEDVDDLI
jgi:transcriptional regulator with GAF, ATPase, and Fis domain